MSWSKRERTSVKVMGMRAEVAGAILALEDAAQLLAAATRRKRWGHDEMVESHLEQAQEQLAAAAAAIQRVLEG